MHPKERQILITNYFCNTLETYDFILSGILISQISHLFFPSKSNFLSLMAGSLTFLIGFITRPLGALFFGYLGDHRGRKKALLLSIYGMSLATLGIGLLPSYDMIGFLAPLGLIFFRLAQGFCLGGEGQGATILTLENYQGTKFGFVGSLLATSNGMGALLAFGISYFSFLWLSEAWGWRLPYLFGSVVALFGFYLRQKIPEPAIFIEHKHSNADQNKESNFVKKNIHNILMAILCVGVGSTLTYTGFAFVNILLKNYLNFSSTTSLLLASIGTVFSMIMVLIGGKVCDRWGIVNTIYYTGILLLILIFPIHFLLSSSQISFIILALILLAILTGGIAGSMPYMLVSVFPIHKRYRGAALSNNIAQAVFGGAQPIVALFLIEKTTFLWSPALFSFSICFIFVIYLFKYKNNINLYDINKKDF